MSFSAWKSRLKIAVEFMAAALSRGQLLGAPCGERCRAVAASGAPPRAGFILSDSSANRHPAAPFMAKMAAVHADSAAARGADPQFAMQSFQHVLALTAPLFLLVLIGYALMRWAGWPAAVSNG
jgi:hypothetical protein